VSHLVTAVAAATLAAACAFPVAARAAPACGTYDYSYAGVSSVVARSGGGAEITIVRLPVVRNGHVAAWVGVGGEGLGPNGTNAWLQVGISALPGQDPALYYEVALPSQAPRHVMLKGHLTVGERFRVAVLESPRRPGSWRVWVNGSPMTKPIYLPGSHNAWRPVVTAESWNGAVAGTCNAFAFRFDDVSVAARPGGAWMPLRGSVLADAGYRVERLRGSLLASGG
jgi:hypothetical protein